MTVSLKTLCRLYFSLHVLLEIHVTVCSPLLGVQDCFVESGALHIVSSTRQIVIECHGLKPVASTASAELLAVVMPSDT